jgi:hypothetical protein
LPSLHGQTSISTLILSLRTCIPPIWLQWTELVEAANQIARPRRRPICGVVEGLSRRRPLVAWPKTARGRYARWYLRAWIYWSPVQEVSTRRAGSRGARVLHRDERGAGDSRARGCCIALCGEWRGAALLRQWANDYGKKKKAQGRFAKLTSGWRAGFCKITPPLTPAYGS